MRPFTCTHRAPRRRGKGRRSRPLRREAEPQEDWTGGRAFGGESVCRTQTWDLACECFGGLTGESSIGGGRMAPRAHMGW